MYKRYYRKYNTDNKSEEQTAREDAETMGRHGREHAIVPVERHFEEKRRNIFDVFKNPRADDLLLLALIFIFLQESVDDDAMLIILVFLFIAGF